MTGRIAVRVWRAPIPNAVRLHIVLACANFWLAAAMGMLIAIHKAAPFLPGLVLSNMFAHAHLAAVGWATMMVVGIGYRLLPMILPPKMPTGRSVYGSAILVETGVLGLFVALLLQSAWSPLFGVLIAAGCAAVRLRRRARRLRGGMPVGEYCARVVPGGNAGVYGVSARLRRTEYRD